MESPTQQETEWLRINPCGPRRGAELSMELRPEDRVGNEAEPSWDLPNQATPPRARTVAPTSEWPSAATQTLAGWAPGLPPALGGDSANSLQEGMLKPASSKDCWHSRTAWKHGAVPPPMRATSKASSGFKRRFPEGLGTPPLKGPCSCTPNQRTSNRPNLSPAREQQKFEHTAWGLDTHRHTHPRVFFFFLRVENEKGIIITQKTATYAQRHAKQA